MEAAMREVVAASLQRIDRDKHGLAARLYPWRQSVDKARVIELDPRRALGKAVVAGTGISIDILRSRYRAGDSVKRLAKDYTVDESKVVAVVARDDKRAA